MVRGLRRVGKVMMAAAFAVAAGGALHAADVGCDPTKLEFKLLATRRFMLDNEVMLSEFVPGESACPSLQNPLMPYCANPLPKLAYGKGAVTLSAPADAAAEGVLFVGAFHPEGYPYKYILLTMDRQNFPGMPSPNWTYGAMYLYGANP